MVCSDCLRKITPLIAKRVGDKYYCPNCYTIIITKIKKSYNVDEGEE